MYLDIIGHAHDLDVFVVRLDLLIEDVDLSDERRVSDALLDALDDSRLDGGFQVGDPLGEFDVGRHGESKKWLCLIRLKENVVYQEVKEVTGSLETSVITAGLGEGNILMGICIFNR